MMKDFDEYVSKLNYPSRSEICSRMREEIDAAPMTTRDRNIALADMQQRATEEFVQGRAPYREDQRRLDAMFWHDCREDLGYDRFLNEDGIGTIEAEAWDRGHSAGYSEVYQCLIRLCEFVEKIVKGIKPGVSL